MVFVKNGTILQPLFDNIQKITNFYKSVDYKIFNLKNIHFFIFRTHDTYIITVNLRCGRCLMAAIQENQNQLVSLLTTINNQIFFINQQKV